VAVSGTISDKEFVRYLTDQDSYSEHGLQTLERLLARYPYCHAFHFAYTAALKKLDADKFDAALQKSAAFCPSREILHRYVEQYRDVKRTFFDKKEAVEAYVPSAYDKQEEGTKEIVDEGQAISEADAQSLVGNFIPHILETEEEEAVNEEQGGSEAVEVDKDQKAEDETFEEIGDTELSKGQALENNPEEELQSKNLESHIEAPVVEEEFIGAQDITEMDDEGENEDEQVFEEIGESTDLVEGAKEEFPAEGREIEEEPIFEEIGEPADFATEGLQEETLDGETSAETEVEEEPVFEEISELEESATEGLKAESLKEEIDIEEEAVFEEIADIQSEEASNVEQDLSKPSSAESADEEVFEEISDIEADKEPEPEVTEEAGAIIAPETESNEEDELFEEISEVPSIDGAESFSILSEETDDEGEVFEEIADIESEGELQGENGEDVVAEAANSTFETESPEESLKAENSSVSPEPVMETVIPESELVLEGTAAASGLAVASSMSPGLGLADEIETVVPENEFPEFRFSSYNIEDLESQSRQAEIQNGEVQNSIASKPSEYANQNVPEERLIVDSIAASDYFVFDRSVVDPLQQSEDVREKEVLPEMLPVPVSPEPELEHDPSDVSKYHDDTMPFTFRWWLHKTRTEHADTYQPYLETPAAAHIMAADPALNQQIIENIFHQQPELNALPETQDTVSKIELRKKEDSIIERFIKEEPQIKPPVANKIDTENKARKSSEDHLDLVSETLAKIYIDQMHYHKAIDIYKKLSLKFPEKRTYFAGQISELEKRIN